MTLVVRKSFEKRTFFFWFEERERGKVFFVLRIIYKAYIQNLKKKVFGLVLQTTEFRVQEESEHVSSNCAFRKLS